MTRSLEMIVALFEYYSVSVVTPGSALEESTPSHDNRYQALAFIIASPTKLKNKVNYLCTKICIFRKSFVQILEQSFRIFVLVVEAMIGDR